LVELIITGQAIYHATEEQWYEYKHWPLGYSKFHKEKWKVKEENEVGQVKLKGNLEEYIRIRIETCEDQKYGKFSQHGSSNAHHHH
jgi:hypothetical protein